MTDHRNHLPAGDAGTSALQALDLPVALTDAASGTLLLENARFFQAFPSTGEVLETLATRLPFLDPETCRERLASGWTVTVETEIAAGARSRIMALDLRQIEHGERLPWLLRGRDLTKQKED